MCPKVGQAWMRDSFCSLAQAYQAGECSLQVRKAVPKLPLCKGYTRMKAFFLFHMVLPGRRGEPGRETLRPSFRVQASAT